MVRALSLTILLAFTSGCQSPFLLFPGGLLEGEEASATDFAFADQYSLLTLETDTGEPYSVFLRVTVIDGSLLIDADKDRGWYQRLKQNPHCRIKLGDKIYPAIAVEVSDEKLASQFLPGRVIFEMKPRDSFSS